MEENLIYILPAFGILGLLYMLFLTSWVNKQAAGNDKMKKLSNSTMYMIQSHPTTLNSIECH